MTLATEFDARTVAEALDRGRTITAAAVELGIHRSTLWRRLRDDDGFVEEVRGWREVMWRERQDRAEAARAAAQATRAARPREVERRLDEHRLRIADLLLEQVESGNVRVLLWLANRLGIERALAGMGSGDDDPPGPAPGPAPGPEPGSAPGSAPGSEPGPDRPAAAGPPPPPASGDDRRRDTGASRTVAGCRSPSRPGADADGLESGEAADPGLALDPEPDDAPDDLEDAQEEDALEDALEDDVEDDVGDPASPFRPDGSLDQERLRVRSNLIRTPPGEWLTLLPLLPEAVRARPVYATMVALNVKAAAIEAEMFAGTPPPGRRRRTAR